MKLDFYVYDVENYSFAVVVSPQFKSDLRISLAGKHLRII